MARTEQRARRVSAEDVRNNARTSGGGGKVFFNLPKGVRQWEPPKADTYKIDFLPYVITSANHPDKIEANMLWYKLPFIIFRNVGVNNESVVSPATFNQPCPLMEEFNRLRQNWDANKDKIDKLGMQKWVAMPMVDPEDKTGVSVMCMSGGKFVNADAGLATELKNGDDSIQNFYDVTADGKTLKVRFTESTYDGSKFLECTRIDFIERPAMNEKEWLAKVPALDDCLIIHPYETLRKMFMGAGVADAPPPASTRTSAAKPKAPEDDAPAAGATKLKEGDVVSFTLKGKLITGKIIDVDKGDISVEDAAGKEYDVDADDVTLTKPEEPAEPAAKPAAVKSGAKTPAAPDFEVGDRVKNTADNSTGIVTKIDLEKDEATVKDDKDGTKSIADVDDLEKIPEDKEDEPRTAYDFQIGMPVTWDGGSESGAIVKMKVGGPKGDKALVKNAEGETWVPVSDLAPAAKPGADSAQAAFAPGDDVTWDDGDEDGEVVKIHSRGTKAKVKDAKGIETWVQLSDLVHAKPPVKK